MRWIAIIFLILAADTALAQLSGAHYFEDITFNLNGRTSLPARQSGSPGLLERARRHVQQKHPMRRTAYLVLGYWGGPKEASILIDVALQDPAALGRRKHHAFMAKINALRGLGFLVGFNPKDSDMAVAFLIRCSRLTFWTDQAWMDLTWTDTPGNAKMYAGVCRRSLAYAPRHNAAAAFSAINHDKSLEKRVRDDAYDQYQRWLHRKRAGMRAAVLNPPERDMEKLLTP